MENKNNNTDQFLGDALKSSMVKVDAPALERMNHIREIVAARKKITQSTDLISLFAAFLNFKIKLYHAVIVFLILWSGYVLLQNKPVQKQEVNSSSYDSGLAAVNNSTVLSSIQTYILRK